MLRMDDAIDDDCGFGESVSSSDSMDDLTLADDSLEPTKTPLADRARIVGEPAAKKLWNNVVVKIVLLGDKGCGKSALFRRVLDDAFVSGPSNTVEPDLRSFYAWLDDDPRDVTKVQISDVPGELHYRWNVSGYTRDVDAALMIFDVTSETSLLSLRPRKEVPDDSEQSWRAIADKGTKFSHRVLVGTKADLLEPTDSGASRSAWLERYSMGGESKRIGEKGHVHGFRYVSARTGNGVFALFMQMARIAYNDLQSPCHQWKDGVDLRRGPLAAKSKKCC